MLDPEDKKPSGYRWLRVLDYRDQKMSRVKHRVEMYGKKFGVAICKKTDGYIDPGLLELIETYFRKTPICLACAKVLLKEKKHAVR